MQLLHIAGDLLGVEAVATAIPYPGAGTLRGDEAAMTAVSPKASWANDPDVQAMLRVKAGDQGSFRGIVERWQGPLIRYFQRSVRSEAEAEDLAQQTFVRLYKAAPKYEASARLSTFLFYIARRLLLNELRRQRRKPADPVDPSDLRQVRDERADQMVAEIEQAFADALAGLPERQRSAILLFKQQGLSYEEIAQSMGATVSSVKTWIHRARQSLKIALKEYHEAH